MMKKILSIAIAMLALSFYANAQYSPAVYDGSNHSYDFGDVLQDTTGGTMKHNKDVTFTMTNFSKGDTYKVELVINTPFTHVYQNCTAVEEQAFTLVGNTSGTVGDIAPTFTIRFNPKNVEIMEQAKIIHVKQAEETVITCQKSGRFVDGYGNKSATVKITRTPFCDNGNVVVKAEENSELNTLCAGSSTDEITLSGKSVEKFYVDPYTFSPAIYDKSTKKYSYDFGDALQDTVGMKHNKDITFSVTGFSKGDTYQLALTATNPFSYIDGNCTSTESNPFTIVGNTSGTVGDVAPTFTIRFNPKNVEVMKASNILQVKAEKSVINCTASGTFVNAYGEKTATLKITHTPFCDNVNHVFDVKAEKNVVVCAGGTVREIALSGKSVEKLTTTSVLEKQNAIIVAYPNPVSNVLNFEGEGILYSVNGQLVGQGTNQINVSDLNKGMYILHTTFGMTKIIKE